MPSTPIWSPLSMLVFCFMDTFRRGKVIQCCRMGSAAPWDSQDSRPVPSPISAASVASPSRPLPEERLAARRKIKDFLSSQTAGNAEDPPVATAVAQCALQPAKPRWPTSSGGSPSCEAPILRECGHTPPPGRKCGCNLHCALESLEFQLDWQRHYGRSSQPMRPSPGPLLI